MGVFRRIKKSSGNTEGRVINMKRRSGRRRRMAAFWKRGISCMAAALLAASLAMPSLAVAENPEADAVGAVEAPSTSADGEAASANLLAEEAASSDAEKVEGASTVVVENETASDNAEAVESEKGSADGNEESAAGVTVEASSAGSESENEGSADSGNPAVAVPAASSSSSVSSEPKAEGDGLSYSWNLDASSTDMVELADDGTLTVDVDDYRSSNLVIGTTVSWTASGSEYRPAKSVEIHVPDYLFLGRDGEPYKPGNDENGNATRNGLTVSFGVPQAPSVSADGWQYVHDDENDEYVITNARELAPGTNFVCEVNYSYSYSKTTIYGLEFDGNYHYALASLQPGSAAASARLVENGQQNESRNLSATYEVHANLKEASAEAAGLYMEWQDGWGAAPADAGDYYYVVWNASATLDWFYEPFELEVTTESDLGEVVGTSCVWPKENSVQSSLPDPVDPNDVPISAGHGFAITDAFVVEAAKMAFGSTYFKNQEAHALVLARYPKASVPSGETTELDLSVQATLSPADHDRQTASGAGETPFTPVDFSAPSGNSFELNAASVSVSQYRSSFYQHEGDGQLDALQKGKQAPGRAFAHSMHASAYAETLGEGMDPADPSSYGKKPYTVELIQDMAYLSGQSSLLTSDDYAVTRLLDINATAVTLYEPVADPSTGSLSGKEIEGEIDPLAVTVSTEIGGTWVPVAQWMQTENGRVDLSTLKTLHPGAEFVKYDEAELVPGIRPSIVHNSSRYDGQQRWDLDLPADATGVKMSFETTAFAASIGEQDSSPAWGMAPVVALKPSDAVMGFVGDKTRINMHGLNTLAVRNLAGGLVGFEGDPKGSTSLYDSIEAHDVASHGVSMFHDSYNMNLETGYKTASASSTQFGFTNNTSTATITEEGRLAEFYLTTRSVYDDTIEAQHEATFYVLIPEGATVSMESLRAFESIDAVISATKYAPDGTRYLQSFKYVGDEEVYAPEADITSVETFDDWRGSNRTLLKVGVRATSANAYDAGGAGNTYVAYPTHLRSGFRLSFAVNYPWSSMQDYGSTLEYLYAYEGCGEDLSEYGLKDNASASSISGGSSWTDAEKELMVDLCGERSGDPVWMYRKATQTLNYPTSAQYGLSLAAKGADEATWHMAGSGPEPATVYAGERYQYQVRTAIEDDSTATGNVFYLPLESYEGSEWRGALESVSTSQMSQAGADPKVYYTTQKGLDFATDAARNLDDASIWSQTAPEDMEGVTAVAIDCRKAADGSDFELSGGALIATLTMRAPTEGAGEIAASGAEARQQVFLASALSTAGGSVNDEVLHVEHTAVKLDTMEFGFAKADSAGLVVDGAETEVDEGSLLEGAGFALYRALTDDTAGLVDPGNVDASKWELVGTATSDPQVAFEGLAPGTYRLVETKAPEGYALPKGQWNVTLDPMLPQGRTIEAVSDGGVQPPAFADTDSAGLVLPNVALASIPITGAGGVAGVAAIAACAITAGAILLANMRIGLKEKH